jgi:hypothetical protein
MFKPGYGLIITSRLARAAQTVLSIIGMAAVLAAITLLAAASPAWGPAPQLANRVPAKPAAAAQPAERLASSSMLRESGYAIAKDKLD